MRVRIDNSLLRGFVKRAKHKMPDEYLEVLFGTVSKDTITISALEEIEQEANEGSVTPAEEIQSLDHLGRYSRLGTLHSHPYKKSASGCDIADCAPSEDDWLTQRDQREVVAGICALYPDKKGRIRSRLKFYLANALLDLEQT